MNNEDILQELREKVTRIEVLLEQQAVVESLKMQTLEERLKKIEESQQWIWRIVISAIVTGLVGVLFSFVKFN